MQPWPEGPVADPEAARERYTSDQRASRKALREAIRPICPRRTSDWASSSW
jgi:hypothetical protein